MIANGLRELDRFLSLLIDAAADAIVPAGLNRAAFARLRNTANKLRTIRAAMALPSPDHERLRAIGRARDGLFHCAETARRGDRRPPEARLAHAVRLTPGTDELRDLCRFYDRVAAELVAACAARTVKPICKQRPSPRRRRGPGLYPPEMSSQAERHGFRPSPG